MTTHESILITRAIIAAHPLARTERAYQISVDKAYIYIHYNVAFLHDSEIDPTLQRPNEERQDTYIIELQPLDTVDRVAPLVYAAIDEIEDKPIFEGSFSEWEAMN
jgi:hypothetical protein